MMTLVLIQKRAPSRFIRKGVLPTLFHSTSESFAFPHLPVYDEPPRKLLRPLGFSATAKTHFLRLRTRLRLQPMTQLSVRG